MEEGSVHSKVLNLKNTTQERGHTFMQRARFQSAIQVHCLPNSVPWRLEEISATFQFVFLFAFFARNEGIYGRPWLYASYDFFLCRYSPNLGLAPRP
jgi:hypothetical protein